MIWEKPGDIEVKVPTMLVRGFDGDAVGKKGTGKFNFEVIGSEGGETVVKLNDLEFKTENEADKTYRAMVGENKAPKMETGVVGDDIYVV